MSTEMQMLPLASTLAGCSGHQYEAIPSQLDDDWSFATLKPSKTSWGPHSYHRYPAKFIPQLVRRLIDAYSLPGDLVGDTFVGSATTAIEALRSGRRFWGSDINPVYRLSHHVRHQAAAQSSHSANSDLGEHTPRTC